MFEYYATGKTVPRHARTGIIVLIALMSTLSAAFVWYISTLGDGELYDPSSWNGADPGFGAVTIILAGLFGIIYVATRVRIRGN